MAGAQQVLVGERLCERLDIAPDERVLDVACGSGNTSLAAARRAWGNTVGLDYVPELLARGRERAAAEGLDVDFIEGDAERLPFDRASFDVVTSTFGAMFNIVSEHAPPPPGVDPPALWGTGGRLRELFGDRISDLGVERRTLGVRFRSFEHFLEFFRTYLGPMKVAFERVGGDRAQALVDDLRELAARFDRGGEGAMIIDAEYLEVVAVRA